MKARRIRTQKLRAEQQARMTEDLKLRGSDALGLKFGRIMSDPATRGRCFALKVGESITTDFGGGFEVMVTRLEFGDLAIAVLARRTTT